MKTALCIFAHPDDELGAGGTLCHMAAHGVEVHLLCVTRGEHGAPGYPPLENRAALRRIRTEEMRCAADVIGARSLQFLNYVDEVGPNSEMIEFSHDPTQFQAEIVDAIRQCGADVVITHGSDGEYGHPAHKLVHRTVLASVQSMGANGPLLYSFQASWDNHPDTYLNPLYAIANRTDSAHVIVKVKRYLQSHIMRIYEYHHTQSSWWIHMKTERLGRQATPQESWSLYPEEGFHRHWPVVSGGKPDDAFTQWLQQNTPEDDQ